ncbi:hypothetical protein [Terriglobus albidus]|uniref:hypothetical protein n=1 Tax=Terriglobus albidus TaxID=1592106 RepID=UPI0021E01C52|nr:hypothetical protein [Terriglobus albidus]
MLRLEQAMATPATISFSAQEKALILSELALILESAPFRSSKRYPAMLEYCVRHTLDGETEKLRERQLGIVLFSRTPGYETSSDPIVRMGASEIRKRLAQYYDIAGDLARVRISLPPGSYVAEFRFPEPPHVMPLAAIQPDTRLESVSAAPAMAVQTVPGEHEPGAIARRKRRPIPVFAQVFVSVAIIAACVWGVMSFQSRRQVPALWRGFAGSGNGQVLAVVGQLTPHADDKSMDSDPPLSSDIYRTNHYVSVGDASSAMRACLVLARIGADCQMKAVLATDLSNVHARPVLFVGAYNNPWVLRVTQTLPYRFGDLACKCILDSKDGSHVGGVDFSMPRNKITTDYSIVARFNSEITDGPVVVIAGIGPMSTEAAAEFSAIPERSRELFALAPKGWKGANVEAVLATEVVNGIPGHTRILKATFW